MKILIVGGGIGGLSASIALQQQGHETVVCQQLAFLFFLPTQLTLCWTKTNA